MVCPDPSTLGTPKDGDDTSETTIRNNQSDGVIDGALCRNLDHQLRLLAGDTHEHDEDDSISPAATTTATPCQHPAKRDTPSLCLICDLGYGLPKEQRPRNEKIRAIARQLVNFLHWRHRQQQQQQQRAANNHNSSTSSAPAAPPKDSATVWIVLGASSNDSASHDCCNSSINNQKNKDTSSGIQQVLLERMKEVWQQLTKNSATAPTETRPLFPENTICFTEQSLENVLRNLEASDEESGIDSGDTAGESSNGTPANCQSLTWSTSSSSCRYYYLSPDATTALDAQGPPPRLAVIGLLIDRRRVQTNRSVHRAEQLSIPTARWPLEELISSSSSSRPDDASVVVAGGVVDGIHLHEPLNVDTVLEGMQQWHWNYYSNSCDHDDQHPPQRKNAFRDAALQAIRHHQERHPQRPWHIRETTNKV